MDRAKFMHLLGTRFHLSCWGLFVLHLTLRGHCDKNELADLFVAHTDELVVRLKKPLCLLG